MATIMETEVSKSQFKAKALEILRRVEATGEPVLVTDHGKPTIEVRRHRSLERSPLDLLRGSVVDYLDPTEPVGEQDWEALT
ncbi:MAG: type II toxin-antitoxin system prevent-host-death family antitoxin [Sedimenticolaceae bacterium]|jgi:antitoxin (DNA-binding transcriptional repressor) of toxin-antitoxin stability system